MGCRSSTLPMSSCCWRTRRPTQRTGAGSGPLSNGGVQLTPSSAPCLRLAAPLQMHSSRVSNSLPGSLMTQAPAAPCLMMALVQALLLRALRTCWPALQQGCMTATHAAAILCQFCPLATAWRCTPHHCQHAGNDSSIGGVGQGLAGAQAHDPSGGPSADAAPLGQRQDSQYACLPPAFVFCRVLSHSSQDQTCHLPHC